MLHQRPIGVVERDQHRPRGQRCSAVDRYFQVGQRDRVRVGDEVVEVTSEELRIIDRVVGEDRESPLGKPRGSPLER